MTGPNVSIILTIYTSSVPLVSRAGELGGAGVGELRRIQLAYSAQGGKALAVLGKIIN